MVCHGNQYIGVFPIVDDTISISKEFVLLNDLYPHWNTERVNCYSGTIIPNEFWIDLRGYSFPCDSKLVTSHYGYREKFKRFHKGVDLKLYIGDTVRASFDGVVRMVKYEPQGYGNFVVVRHSNGLETIYGHLSKHLVKVNQRVESGTPIGLGGNTGRSTGSHLHYETRLVGYAINPELMFNFEKHQLRDAESDGYLFVL